MHSSSVGEGWCDFESSSVRVSQSYTGWFCSLLTFLRSFRPEVLTCRQGSNTSECLTIDQLEALRKLYSDYLDADQNWIFSGYAPGGELGYPDGLATAEPFPIANDYYKYFVLKWVLSTICSDKMLM